MRQLCNDPIRRILVLAAMVAATFDFVVAIGGPVAQLAAELMRTGSQWVLRASDTVRLERIGFACSADGKSG